MQVFPCVDYTIHYMVTLISSVHYRTSTMPKAGFKSITVSENVYKKFFEIYEKSKKELELKGITSFSGYLTSMMEEMMIKYEAFAKHAPFMEKISIDQNRVIVKDNKRNRIAEVLFKNGELQCLLDERTDCVHVGFVYSLPEIYFVINSKAVKIPRSLY